jgi:hypothetical protein
MCKEGRGGGQSDGSHGVAEWRERGGPFQGDEVRSAREELPDLDTWAREGGGAVEFLEEEDKVMGVQERRNDISNYKPVSVD